MGISATLASMAMFETLTRAAVISSALLATLVAATVWEFGWERWVFSWQVQND